MGDCVRRTFLQQLAVMGVSAPLFGLEFPSDRPDSNAAGLPDGSDALLRYFASVAPRLLRAPEGVLKYPSVAPSLPGKQYATTLWDWDAYWTCRGLFRLAARTSNKDLQRRVAEHATGSLLNFFDHQSAEGRLPIMITVTDSDFFGVLQRARNQAKPVFGQFALLIADETHSVAWLGPHFDKLVRFYRSWAEKNFTPAGLFVWGDDVAIGDDNDPTTFGRPFYSSANLLLNCLMYQDLQAASTLAGRLGRTEDEKRLTEQAAALARSIEEHCWDQRDRFYYTVDVQCADRRRELIPNVEPGMAMSWQTLPLRIQMFTGFLPLWCGLASAQRARELVETNYLADDRLRAAWGVRSLSAREKMYCMDFSSNPSNWLGPVWIIVNYLVWGALRRYGFTGPAQELAQKTVRLLSADLAKNGSLNEYYHPDTGAALSHPGFMDWDLLVLEML